jgi:hypothetical protein
LSMIYFPNYIFSYLVFSTLKLVENGLSLWSNVQLGWIIDEENNISAVNEPLARVVEWEKTFDLLSDLQNSWDLDNVNLGILI